MSNNPQFLAKEDTGKKLLSVSVRWSERDKSNPDINAFFFREFKNQAQAMSLVGFLVSGLKNHLVINDAQSIDDIPNFGDIEVHMIEVYYLFDDSEDEDR